ncbi:hypothetical protein DMN91_010574 [Ooceraea biroi]|uniref:Uncharacterized protein n=1 Tax=Ooceraea biroi TaxID=2015173 RepID=A0A3L8D897_OOCBI|nr:hypothetical protein DMN91_010574 [Ooceraea biroi]
MLRTYLLSIFFIVDNTRKFRGKEKEPKSTTTSSRGSLENSTASQYRNTQKRTTPSSKHSRNDMKNLRISFTESKNYKSKKYQVSQSTSESSTSTYLPQKLRASNTDSAGPGTFGQIAGSSRAEQICTCGGRGNSQRRNSHGCANSWSIPGEERSRRRRRRRRHGRKKASKRESDRPRDCFTTFCVCMRGRSLDELSACKCASSHEVLSSHHECCCVQVNLQ